MLEELEVADAGATVTSEQRSRVSRAHQSQINGESNKIIWDEMAFLLGMDTNLPRTRITMCEPGAPG